MMKSPNIESILQVSSLKAWTCQSWKVMLLVDAGLVYPWTLEQLPASPELFSLDPFKHSLIVLTSKNKIIRSTGISNFHLKKDFICQSVRNFACFPGWWCFTMWLLWQYGVVWSTSRSDGNPFRIWPDLVMSCLHAMSIQTTIDFPTSRLLSIQL